MTNAYEIIRDAHDRFKGLAVKLSRLTDKSEEWFRSHGREPKTDNPLQTGNKSPATAFMKYVRLNEAAIPGAGKFINNRTHAELDAEFAENDFMEISQRDLHVGVIEQACDVNKWLAQSICSRRRETTCWALNGNAARLWTQFYRQRHVPACWSTKWN